MNRTIATLAAGSAIVASSLAGFGLTSALAQTDDGTTDSTVQESSEDGTASDDTTDQSTEDSTDQSAEDGTEAPSAEAPTDGSQRPEDCPEGADGAPTAPGAGSSSDATAQASSYAA